MGVLAVSSAAVLIRLAEAPVLVVAAYRMGIASAAIAGGAAAVERHRFAALGRGQVVWMGLSGCFLALHFGFWIASLSYTSVASSVVLVTSSPLMVAIASAALSRERLGLREAQGIALGVAGGIVVAAGDFGLGRDELIGDLLALAGSVAVTGYLLIGRRLRAEQSALTYAAGVYPIAAVLLAAAALTAGEGFGGYSAATYTWLVLVALIPQVLGHTSLNWALGHVTATLVAIAIMGEPVLATLLAWIVLDEAPPIATVIGGALIIGGVYRALAAPK